MSMTFETYVIYGWDITDWVDQEKFEDWKWEDENEKYFNSQCQGHVQLWDGGAYSDRIYLGYCIWSAEENNYSGATTWELEAGDREVYDKNGVEFLNLFGHMYRDEILDRKFANATEDPAIICFAEWR